MSEDSPDSAPQRLCDDPPQQSERAGCRRLSAGQLIAD